MVSVRLLIAGLLAVLVAPATLAEPAIRTTHEIRLGDSVLRYTAETGRLDIVSPGTDEVRAQMFYVAYRPHTSAASRPVAFVWNGGPGAPSATLHFTSIGPKRLEGERLIDNPDTLLPFADLVFVDAVGTGFSRVTSERFAPEFYNTLGDIDAFTAFVRAWRGLHESSDAPVVLIGESFGGPRAAGVAARLLTLTDRVDGVVLISGGLGLGRDALPRERAAALRVPEWAVVATRHGKGLPGDAESINARAAGWANDVYAPALARIDQLSDEEREAIVADLARFTGIPAAAIDRRALVVTPRQFRTELLKDRGLVLATFDLRRTSAVEFTPGQSAAMERSIRDDLGFRTSLRYIGLGGAAYESVDETSGSPQLSVNERWDYFAPGTPPDARARAIADAIRVGGGPPGVSEPWLRQAFGLNRRLKVLVATGRYDAGQCLVMRETVRRLESPLRDAYTERCYEGGHMMYLDDDARAALAADLRAFIQLLSQ